ncbi:uncharacterized protein LOC120209779 [Hibiscus syriacus]|uniref:uncharacterized protein LOC120209779 n=1 Tax=Hibiscus syriacus TaxID=106335 RepID=UPI00192467C3|nr:uncharacterized protein LOC120209779 [Hibiscus syriacus]
MKLSIKPGSGDGRARASVGSALSAEYWGRGIASAALRMAVYDVFSVFEGVVRLEALVEVENVGSQRVLEKVGFVKEGLLRKYGFCKGEIRGMIVCSFLSTDTIT